MSTESTYLYRYGLIAAGASAAISRYRERGRRDLDKPEVEMVKMAAELVNDALRGGNLFEPGDENRLNADSSAVQAFGSSLSAISGCGASHEFSDLRSVLSWFRRVNELLSHLAEPGHGEQISDEDLEDAKRYFDCLARQTISELNRPPVESPVFQGT